MKNELKDLQEINRNLNAAISVIETVCRDKHKRFSYDTKVPYGYGIDVFLLKACTLFERYSNNRELTYDLLKGDNTVGDIFEVKNKMEWIILGKIKNDNELRDLGVEGV